MNSPMKWTIHAQKTTKTSKHNLFLSYKDIKLSTKEKALSYANISQVSMVTLSILAFEDESHDFTAKEH